MSEDEAAERAVADVRAGEQAPPVRPPKPSADALTQAIRAGYEFARDPGGELFLLPGKALPDVPYIPRSFLKSDVINLLHVTWEEMALAWNAWLTGADLSGMSEREIRAGGLTQATPTPSETPVRSTARHLEATGMETGRLVSAALRAVQVREGIVIDLGDATGEVAYVTADGWKVTDPRALPFPPPVFRRSLGYLPLPRPVPGGDLAAAWGILGIAGKEHAAARALVTGWLAGVYFTGVPRPGLWLTGPPGAGKTTSGGVLARLVNGAEWLDGKLDKTDEKNNVIRAVTSFLVTMDNMTKVTEEQSDWICNLVTGHSDTFRKLYTNLDDVSVGYMRTFTATGLSLPYGLGDDALDRVTEVPLPAMPDARRLDDDAIRHDLDTARPALLGALLDHVAAVLRELPAVSGGGARMSGYARILAAHDKAYPPEKGEGEASCLKAFLAAGREVRGRRAEHDPVIAALDSLMNTTAPMWCKCGCRNGDKVPMPTGEECRGPWFGGTATDLFTLLFGRQGERFPPAGQPGSPRALSDRLNALARVLDEQRYQVRRIAKGRRIAIRRQPPD